MAHEVNSPNRNQCRELTRKNWSNKSNGNGKSWQLPPKLSDLFRQSPRPSNDLKGTYEQGRSFSHQAQGSKNAESKVFGANARPVEESREVQPQRQRHSR